MFSGNYTFFFQMRGIRIFGPTNFPAAREERSHSLGHVNPESRTLVREINNTSRGGYMTNRTTQERRDCFQVIIRYCHIYASQLIFLFQIISGGFNVVANGGWIQCLIICNPTHLPFPTVGFKSYSNFWEKNNLVV